MHKHGMPYYLLCSFLSQCQRRRSMTWGTDSTLASRIREFSAAMHASHSAAVLLPHIHAYVLSLIHSVRRSLNCRTAVVTGTVCFPSPGAWRMWTARNSIATTPMRTEVSTGALGARVYVCCRSIVVSCGALTIYLCVILSTAYLSRITNSYIRAHPCNT